MVPVCLMLRLHVDCILTDLLPARAHHAWDTLKCYGHTATAAERMPLMTYTQASFYKEKHDTLTLTVPSGPVFLHNALRAVRFISLVWMGLSYP